MKASVRWHQGLAARLGAVLVLFVVVGSLLLLAWLQHLQQRESERVFLMLAQTDADFVRRLNLPRSTKLAVDLRQLLGMEIFFRDARQQLEPPGAERLVAALPVADTIQVLPPSRQAVVLRLDERHDMIFVRDAPPVTLSLLNPATRHALLAFWLLSAGLGWMIARQVLGPLGALTRKLPDFFSHSATPAEACREDEIGQLARALAQARDDLMEERVKRERAERLALLGRVAAGLAHEIKNPLASIQLHAQLIDVGALEEESRTSLVHIGTESKVIEGLVSQWLYLARPQPPQCRPLDLTACIDEVVGAMRAQADHAGVRLQVGHEGPLSSKGDRPRLQQVFRNVILNALQAMPRGGVLRISTMMKGGGCCVRVHDGGPGFSKAALEHGAELFFSEKEGGMGVGLNVAQEIVSAHGGRMTLGNAPEGGAVVEVCLPPA